MQCYSAHEMAVTRSSLCQCKVCRQSQHAILLMLGYGKFLGPLAIVKRGTRAESHHELKHFRGDQRSLIASCDRPPSIIIDEARLIRQVKAGFNSIEVCTTRERKMKSRTSTKAAGINGTQVNTDRLRYTAERHRLAGVSCTGTVRQKQLYMKDISASHGLPDQT